MLKGNEMFEYYIEKGWHRLYIGPATENCMVLYAARHMVTKNYLTYVESCANIKSKLAMGYQLKKINRSVCEIQR